MLPLSVVGVLFSKDRAMQLDACLRSFYSCCLDPELVDLTILYRTSTARHSKQYVQIVQEYSAGHALKFVAERHFRQNLLEILLAHARLAKWQENVFRTALRLPNQLSSVINPLLSPIKIAYVLFLVDDILFTRPFRLQEIVESVEAQPAAIGFSFRLGMNTTYCYPLDKNQRLPKFSRIALGILKFDWTVAELDFHYPLEVSSSLFRMDQIIPILNSINFRNPNNLESRLAKKASSMARCHPELMCYETSAAFSNPINKVQFQDSNRFSKKEEYSPEKLAEQFEKGFRIDINP